MAETVNAADLARQGAFRLSEGQLLQMREIAKVIHDDPSRLAEFERDPEAFARAVNGFEVPAGFHIHVADAQNNLYPTEEEGIFGAEDRAAWARLEFRAGYKTFSLVACV